MLITPLLHSLLISILATCLSFLFMFPLAYLSVFKPYPGKNLVEILLLLPLVLPPTIIGLGLLQVFGKFGPLAFMGNALIFSLSGAVLATTIITFPFVYQGLKSGFMGIPKEQLDVAYVYGANPIQLLLYVIFPGSWSLILVSILLSFCRALGEFGSSLMVAGYIPGKTDTLANSIYFNVQNGNNTQALFLALINIIFGVLVLALVLLFNKKIKRN